MSYKKQLEKLEGYFEKKDKRSTMKRRKSMKQMDTPFEIAQSGQAFSFCWDNGFSYCGSEPATKEQYLMAVDKALAKRFSFGETCGIQIPKASQYGETFAIKVCIGADTRYSEVSFS